MTILAILLIVIGIYLCYISLKDGVISMATKYSTEFKLEPMEAISQIAMYIMQGATVNYNPQTKKLKVTYKLQDSNTANKAERGDVS